MDALLDPVAMASWAVEAGEAPMLAAVLPVAAEAAVESFASELLLTAAWSGDLECSEVGDPPRYVADRTLSCLPAVERGGIDGRIKRAELRACFMARPAFTVCWQFDKFDTVSLAE